jgi:hypothetical protein
MTEYGDGDAEQPQVGEAAVHRLPSVRAAVFDVADRGRRAGAGRPGPHQLTGGEQFVGDRGGHRRLLGGSGGWSAAGTVH